MRIWDLKWIQEKWNSFCSLLKTLSFESWYISKQKDCGGEESKRKQVRTFYGWGWFRKSKENCVGKYSFILRNEIQNERAFIFVHFLYRLFWFLLYYLSRNLTIRESKFVKLWTYCYYILYFCLNIDLRVGGKSQFAHYRDKHDVLKLKWA